MNGRLMGRGNRQLMGVDTLWIGENGRPQVRGDCGEHVMVLIRSANGACPTTSSIGWKG